MKEHNKIHYLHIYLAALVQTSNINLDHKIPCIKEEALVSSPTISKMLLICFLLAFAPAAFSQDCPIMEPSICSDTDVACDMGMSMAPAGMKTTVYIC